jgi:hypothetical protein
MRKTVTILLAIFMAIGVNAQIFGPESINMPGTWDSFTNPPTVDALRNPNQSASGDITLIITQPFTALPLGVMWPLEHLLGYLQVAPQEIILATSGQT